MQVYADNAATTRMHQTPVLAAILSPSLVCAQQTS